MKDIAERPLGNGSQDSDSHSVYAGFHYTRIAHRIARRLFRAAISDCFSHSLRNLRHLNGVCVRMNRPVGMDRDLTHASRTLSSGTGARTGPFQPQRQKASFWPRSSFTMRTWRSPQ